MKDINGIIGDLANALVKRRIQFARVIHRAYGGWQLSGPGGYLFGVPIIEFVPDEMTITLRVRRIFSSRHVKTWDVSGDVDADSLIESICDSVEHEYWKTHRRKNSSKR